MNVPTPETNGGSGVLYQAEKVSGKALTEWKSNDIIKETKDAAGNRVFVVKKIVVRNGPSNGITQRENAKGGIDRNYYDSNGIQIKQISNNDHGHKEERKFGKHGEHAHDYFINENGDVVHGKARELNDSERLENGDIL